MSEWVVGADLGGTKITLGLVSPQDEIAARERIATRDHEGAEAVVSRIAATIDRLSTALPPGEKVTALGICTPGPVDHETGMVIDPPNVQGLHHTPLRQMLSDRLGIPAVLEHDAKAAALGDFHYGAGRDAPSMVYIVVGTGVGAAIISQGGLYRGDHNSAGEIGHTTLDRAGELCSCGSRGCVETYISGPWLARRYLAQLEEPAAIISPGTLDTISGEHVSQLASHGDRHAQFVLQQAGEALGTAIATLAMVLGIDLYVIGGSVAQAGDLLIAPARQIAPNYSFASVGSRVKIVATQLGEDGAILGCAWLARKTI